MKKEKINLVDLTLRDGMHAVSHQFTAETMANLARQIDSIGYESLEIGHGNGLAGSSIQYGFAASTDEEYLAAVSAAVEKTPVCIVIIPGIGTRYELQIARDAGVKVARIATQITECDIGKQHVAMAREMGFHTRTLLPHAAPLSVEDTVKYAEMSASFGSQVVYILDGGGAMLPGEVYERVARSRDAVAKHGAQIGFHGHNNLSLAVANSLEAVRGGATYIDTCLRGFGAGAGNCAVEPFAAALEKQGYVTGVDLLGAMDAGDTYLKPLMPRPMELNSDQVMLGRWGVYSSFLLFARRAGEAYGVDPREIIKGIGIRGCTEGQEHVCIEVAYELANGKRAD